MTTGRTNSDGRDVFASDACGKKVMDPQKRNKNNRASRHIFSWRKFFISNPLNSGYHLLYYEIQKNACFQEMMPGGKNRGDQEWISLCVMDVCDQS
ncbi:MAG: hypothetical protein JRG79_13410 [Deltaproteobacteria bacterium]|nr:hypothetical protein [Deltaproteobacteria bacterium]